MKVVIELESEDIPLVKEALEDSSREAGRAAEANPHLRSELLLIKGQIERILAKL